jgi:hypothetical protein
VAIAVRRCGIGRRGDGIGIGFNVDEVIVDGRYDTGGSFRSTADDNIGMLYSNVNGWPMRWVCPACGWSVRLEHAASQRIGTAPRIVIPASPP